MIAWQFPSETGCEKGKDTMSTREKFKRRKTLIFLEELREELRSDN